MELVNETRICYLCEKPVAIVGLSHDDKLVCEHCGAERRVKDYLPLGDAQTAKGENSHVSDGNNEVLQGCSIGCLVVILIGVVVLLVALSQIGQAIDDVGDFLDGLNPWNWGWNNGRGKP